MYIYWYLSIENFHLPLYCWWLIWPIKNYAKSPEKWPKPWHMGTHLRVQVNLYMRDHCTTDFCLWWTICLVPVPCISSMFHMCMKDFAYHGPIILVPLNPSYPSSPVLSESYPISNNMVGFKCCSKLCILVLWTKVASALEGLICFVVGFPLSICFLNS